MRPNAPATGLLLLVLLLPGLGGLSPAAAPSGPAPVPAPVEGELFYYEGTLKRDGAREPWALLVRVGAPQAMADRTGAARVAYPVETVSAPPGRLEGPERLMADPDAPRTTWWHDAVTHEAVAMESVLRTAEDDGPLPPGAATPLKERGWVGIRHSYFDRGLVHPLAGLWGSPLPGGPLTLDLIVGAEWGWSHRTGSLARELLGLGPGLMQAPAGAGDAQGLPVRFDPGTDEAKDRAASPEAEGARWFTATYAVPHGGAARTVRHVLALAPDRALPVAERFESREGAHELHLVRHVAGAPLPDASPPPTPPGGRMGALDVDGPADDGAGLAYPLAEAVRAVRSDPTLEGYRALARSGSGEPVLVKAFYEERRRPDAETPLPEARWLLVFHDGRGASAAVESKRPVAAAPVAVNRPQERADLAPYLGAVGPGDLPRSGPTLGAATRAWRAWEHGGGDGNVLYYALRRTPEGEVQPLVWSGRSHDTSGAWPGGAVGTRQAQSMLALDADGLARFTLERETRSGVALTSLGGGASPPPEPEDPPAPALDPVAVAVGAGAGAAAMGALVRLLAPLYSRLGPDRVLEHPVRRALLEAVRREPGLHLRAAQRRLGIGRGAVAYHVQVLAARGYLRVQRQGRYRRLYGGGTSGAEMARAAALRQPRTRALHDLVARRPGVGLREAARRLDVPPSSLQWHVERLARAGLVERRRDGLYPAEPSSGSSTGHDAS